MKERLAEVYEEKEQNIEDLLVLGDSKGNTSKSHKKDKSRKREKKERRKKRKKKHRGSSSSSSSSGAGEDSKARRMSEGEESAGPAVP